MKPGRRWLWGGLLLLLLGGLRADAAPAPATGRTYTLYAQAEFTGPACGAGWQWQDGWGAATYSCTGDTVRLLPASATTQYRTTGLLWRNDLLPSSGNLAIETRVRLAAYAGYGNDPLVLLPSPYHGERQCYDGVQGHHQNAPACPVAPPPGYWGVHGAGNAHTLYIGLFGQDYLEIPATTHWHIVRWEYTAATHQWVMRVFRTAAQPPGTQPYAGPPTATYTVTAALRPQAVRLGHPLYFTGPEGAYGPGYWSSPETDYLRVWTWTAYALAPTLTREYPWLVWYGPQVGQPTQVLRGTGYTPQGAVTVQVAGPAGCGRHTYLVTADAAGAWTLDALSSGEGWFGTACRGTWQATATDAASGLGSPAATWTVAWFPVRRTR